MKMKNTASPGPEDQDQARKVFFPLPWIRCMIPRGVLKQYAQAYELKEENFRFGTAGQDR